MSGKSIRCTVGVTAYNEEANIGRLLQAIIDQKLYEVEIADIIVIASGCTDGTEAIVRQFMVKDPRIQLYTQEKREGKTSATTPLTSSKYWPNEAQRKVKEVTARSVPSNRSSSSSWAVTSS